MLGQLLVEARVQADFSISVWERFDLIELLRQITEDMREAAQKLGIDIQLISDVRRLPFEGDRTRLTRAFYNILENSLKYMNAAGKITVTVSLMEDKQVFLAFKDDGAGMDREEAEHVFELNYQGSNGSHGNGMGLYLVYVTALAHHGTVSARSSPGKGMSIVFLLPQEQGKKQTAHEAGSAAGDRAHGSPVLFLPKNACRGFVCVKKSVLRRKKRRKLCILENL